MKPSNDDVDEAQAERPAVGPHYVTLESGVALCSFCGHLWWWEAGPAPTECPLENG